MKVSPTITVRRAPDGMFEAVIVEGEKKTRAGANRLQGIADFLEERYPGVVVHWQIEHGFTIWNE